MPQATGLAAELTGTFPEAKIDLVESQGGAFEISVDGTLVFSKLALKRFPAYQEIPRLMGA